MYSAPRSHRLKAIYVTINEFNFQFQDLSKHAAGHAIDLLNFYPSSFRNNFSRSMLSGRVSFLFVAHFTRGKEAMQSYMEKSVPLSMENIRKNCFISLIFVRNDIK